MLSTLHGISQATFEIAPGRLLSRLSWTHFLFENRQNTRMSDGLKHKDYEVGPRRLSLPEKSDCSTIIRKQAGVAVNLIF